jgi:predicted CoA-binding protein
MHRNPGATELRELLTRTRTIAVLGASPNPERPSHRIARRLMGWGYRVIPVRPAVAEVLGEKAYARLSDVPGPIDLVNVFRAAREAPAIVEQCIALGVKAVWFQEGIVHEQAAERARAAGLTVVMDRCISVEHRRLMT